MKRANIIFSLVCLLLTAASTQAQSRDDAPLAGVEKSISTGDVEALSQMASERIEIAVLGTASFYSRSQARFVLKGFFDQYPPLRFKLSEPSRTPKGLFVAGSYHHRAGDEPLKVYVRLRKNGSGWTLREILIEKPSGD